MKKHIKVVLKSRTVKSRVIVLCGVLGILLSCNAQKNTQKNAASDDDRLTLILQDNYGGSDSTEVLIIKDTKRLQSFFAEINRTRKPGLPVPKIDFDQEIAIIFCGGLQRGNATPELSILEESPTTLVLRSNKPKQTSGTAIISPFSLYTLPITQKEIVVKGE
ncbi:hypothetical protein [Kriegella aquimaris]|uniref:PrcB C-terminal n=1 Tax=Kriegella aquimaris TaxID=192904 RepID=A0A1G9JST2_9FLAO|nr:hypothetical protein [Kriegella aquimaris]SDL40432.1 hypothetical protein SAMN04488514_101693 [Kriegella aquimaris]